MENMDNPLWEKILVDWVNCLKLSKPIQKLDELRDGLFFSNLQKVLKKSSEVDPDVLSCIFDILNKHYAQFVIPNNLSIHLNDLPTTDLTAITSLLMHYTCIHDRRDVLTSPLCYNLQEFTQIKIRHFLERVQESTNLSYDELAAVIKTCTGEQSQIQHWLSSNSFNNLRSPLEDVLNTPVLKSTRMIERDKQITKLKSNLELVQEEKETLEKELKNLITKNKRLEKQLSQKNIEVSNLRCEVLELESRTPPHYRDRNYRDMQKLLRTQVEGLELELEQLVKENEQLQEERNKQKAEARQLESQCKTWLEKFIETEKCLQSVTENYNEQLTKNENLKSHCVELEAFLDELRPKSKNESFIEDSFCNMKRWSRGLEEQSGEDLAHSVVDIQLKELQKENEKLITNLDTIREEKARISNKLYEYKSENEINLQAITDLKSINETLIAEKDSLFKSLQKVTEEKKILNSENENLKNLLDSADDLSKVMKEQINKLTFDLESNCSKNNELCNTINTIENDLKNISKKMSLVESDLQNCTAEKEYIFEQYKLCSRNLDESNLKTELIIEKKDQLDKMLQESNKKLEEVESDYEKIYANYQSKVKELVDVEEELKCIKANLENTTSNLNNKLLENEKLITSLEDVNNVTKKMTRKINIFTMVEENEVTYSEDTVVTDGKNLDIIFKELQINLSYLDSALKDVYTEKEKLEHILVSTNDLTKELEEEKNEILIKLESSQTTNKDLKEQINKLTLGFESKNNELCEKITKNTEKIFFMETDLQNCTVEKANISEHYELCSRNLVESNLKIEKMSAENENLTRTIKDAQDQLKIFKTNEKELSSQLIEISNKLESVTNDKENIFGDLSECKFENERYLADIVQIQSRIGNLISEKEYLSKNFQEVTLRLTDCQLENERYLKEHKDLTSKIKTLIEEKESLSNTIQKVSEEKTVLSNNLDLNNNELKKVMQQKDELVDVLSLRNKDIENILNEKECILEENDRLVKANVDLSQYLDTLKHDYKKVSSEKNLAIERCDTISKKMSLVERDLQNCTAEKANISKQYELCSKNLNESYLKIEKISAENDHLTLTIKDAQDQLELFKTNEKKLFAQLTEIHNKLESVPNDKENIFGELNECQFENKRYLADIIQIQSRIGDLISEKEYLSKNLQEITLTLSECQVENERYLMDNEGYLKENKDLKSKIESLITEKECLSDTIEKVSEEKTILSNTLELNNNELQKVIHQKDKISDALALSNKDMEKIIKEKECFLEENDHLAKTNIDLTQYLDTLKHDYEKMSYEKNSANKRCDNITKKLEDCYQEINKLLEEKNNLLEQLCQVKTKLSEKLIDINNLGHEKSSSIEEKNRLEKQLQESNKRLEEVELNYEKISENYQSKVKEMVQESNKRLEEVELNYEKISENYQSKVKEMVDLEEELKYFKTNLKSTMSDLKTKLLENEKLTTSLEDVNNITKKIIQQINLMDIVEENKVTCSEDTMASEGRNLESIFIELCNNINRLDSALKHVYTEKENLEHLLEATSGLSKDLKEEINKLALKLESNQSKNNDEVHKLKEDFKTVSENLSKTENDLQVCLTEKANISEKYECSLINLKDSNFKIKEISSYLESFTEEKDNLNQIIKTVQSQLDSLSLNNEQLSAALEIVSNEKENVISKLSECELKNEKYVKEIADLSQTFNTYKENCEKLSAENCDISDRFEKVNKELENYSQKINNLSKEKNNLLEQVEKLSQAKAKFSEQLDQVSQENADLSDKIQNLMKKNYENSEYIKDLLQKVEHLTSENTELLGKFTTLSNDLEEKSKNANLLEVTCKEIKKQLEDKSEILDKLSEENNGIFDIVDRLSQEKIEMMHTIDSISEEKMQLLKAIEDLSNEIEELSQEKVKLKECLDLSERELQKVKKDRNEILEDQTKIMKETESNLLLARQSAVDVKNDLLKRIENAEDANEILRKQLEQDSKKLQESYLSVVTSNSKLELEILNLRKKIEDKNRQLNDLSQIKETYEKLVEENNSLLTEIDTIKFKRSRDREEFVILLKKEREEADFRESKRVKEIRTEYEGKLEKMKDKMLKLYRDEVNKEMLKVKAEQSETMCYLKTIEDLRNDLSETEHKAHLLETKLEMQKINESKSQHPSLTSLRSRHEQSESVRGSLTSLRSFGVDNMKTRKESMQLNKKGKSVSTLPSHTYRESIVSGRDRRLATLPRSNVTEIQETVTISRRTSLNNVPNLEMEDEDDDFNNKYLDDLKKGKCILGNNGRESNASRFSELAWRNSMVPPHLKSSYPAETQFASPSIFKEDDLKVGNIDLDDSLCKLLPGEKHRHKKDFGTTSYKKPGPPTPSKNGGRASLQSNEIQPLREQNDRSPKKTTPSRIKSLFMGKTTIREHSENQNITPRTLRKLSIFRKQK